MELSAQVLYGPQYQADVHIPLFTTFFVVPQDSHLFI